MIWPIHRTDYDGNTLTAIRKRNSSTVQLTAVQSRQAITNNNKFVFFSCSIDHLYMINTQIY